MSEFESVKCGQCQKPFKKDFLQKSIGVRVLVKLGRGDVGDVFFINRCSCDGHVMPIIETDENDVRVDFRQYGMHL